MLSYEVFATLFAVLMLPMCFFMVSPGEGGGGDGNAAEEEDK